MAAARSMTGCSFHYDFSFAEARPAVQYFDAEKRHIVGGKCRPQPLSSRGHGISDAVRQRVCTVPF